jgi:hypothetical protein
MKGVLSRSATRLAAAGAVVNRVGNRVAGGGAVMPQAFLNARGAATPRGRARLRASRGPQAPPRFVVRTMVATLVMVAAVLTAVFVGVTVNVRYRVRGSVANQLEAGQRMLSALEQRRAREMSAQVATLAENPTLKAALDTYRTETGAARQRFRREMLLTIDRELEKIAARVRSDILAVTDGSGTVLAVAGRRQADWPVNARVPTQQDSTGEAYVSLPSGVFQFASAPVSLQDTEIGSLQLAKALDARYAQELSALSGAGTLIVSGEQTVASTLNAESTRALTPAVLHALPSSDVVSSPLRSTRGIRTRLVTPSGSASFRLPLAAKWG